MAAKSLTEVVESLEIGMTIKRILCIGEMSQVAPRIETAVTLLERKIRGEIRDFLAHEVARFCKRHNAMHSYGVLTQFVQEVVKDIPATGGDK